jgi:acid phosphatase (class A)
MRNARQTQVAMAALAALEFAGCSKGKLPSFRSRSEAAAPSETRSYLAGKFMPDSVAILPPPPAQDSQEMARDLAVRRTGLELRGTPRYDLAIADADRSEASTSKAFQCAFGTEIGARTPALARMLAKIRLDVRAAAYKAKEHYKRPRPWVANHGQVCRSSEELVRNDGSYPSARGAVGWAYAFVLGEVNPVRRNAVIVRAREFGESRVICDAEWQSDVDAGRMLALEAVRRMHRNRDFAADLSAARKEVAEQLRSSGPARMDCSLEDQAHSIDEKFAAAITEASKPK